MMAPSPIVGLEKLVNILLPFLVWGGDDGGGGIKTKRRY
jgi:hypothetical protein